MTILVTGFKGFIGRHLVKKLEDQDYLVYGLDRDKKDRSYEDVWEKLMMVPWSKIKRIYHLGAITDTGNYDAREMFQFNVDFSIQLFTMAAKWDIPVHYASSAAVYGNSKYNEYNPLNQYALSKLMVDQWVIDHLAGKRIIGFRPFNVYGPDEQKGAMTSFVSKFIRQGKEMESIQLFNSSNNFFRDCIHVDDVVEIMTRRYEFSQDVPHIYDLGTGAAQNIEAVAQMVAAKTNTKLNHVPMPKHMVSKYQTYTKALKFAPGAEPAKFKYTFVRDWLNEVL